jgi:FkbM family methyltransferase
MGIIKRTLKRIPLFYGRFGWKGVAIIYRQKSKSAKLIKFNYRKKFRHSIYLRPGTSDFPVFESVMVQHGYEIDYGLSPKVIFDCGANIGLTTVFYANRFPEAKIISIEPEADNFALLKKNTEHYPNVHIYQNGLWNKATSLKVEDKGFGEWGFMASEVPEGTHGAVKTVTIPDLMHQQECNEIDILKIDIEGSEKELFESNYETWLSKVKVLVIELHDRMREGASLSFFRALTKYHFTLDIKGENIVCFIKHPLNQSM